MTFDPNAAGQRNGRFGGLPTTPEEAEVLLLPVPWDVTVSSGDGTRSGPAAILDVSPQLEFLNPRNGRVWTSLAMLPAPQRLNAAGFLLRSRAADVIRWIENGESPARAQTMHALRETINAGCAEMVVAVDKACRPWIEQSRIVGVVGGDHSTPLGLYRALARHHGPFGILHVDAHCDLRLAYEGFRFSHASIMRNAWEEELVQQLVQVGVRDFCAEELETLAASHGRMIAWDARSLARRTATGEPWAKTVGQILEPLPRDVVVSLDIDGLEPWLCPHTGTPVPGGLDYEACFFLFEELVERGHRILGFDVTEVCPAPDGGGVDAIVGARAVYRLACLAADSLRSA